MLHKLTFYGLTDKGLVRQNNEDFMGQVPEKQFYVLADGMGGHQAGEVASMLAVEKVCEIVTKEWDASHTDIEQGKKFLQNAIQIANSAIFEQGKQYADCRGMGTTICCLLFHQDGVIYAHVGDSRIYRLRKGELMPLTQDHSLLREMRENGVTNNHNQYRHVLTKAVGTEPFVDSCIAAKDVLPGDVYLMCSDGLTDLLTNEEIQSILNTTDEDKAPLVLINKAKERGGHDNITILEVKVHEAHIPR